MKFTKNQRLSLNCGNSSLRSSDSPQFLTLIPRFSSREFPDADSVLSYRFLSRVTRHASRVTIHGQ